MCAAVAMPAIESSCPANDASAESSPIAELRTITGCGSRLALARSRSAAISAGSEARE